MYHVQVKILKCPQNVYGKLCKIMMLVRNNAVRNNGVRNNVRNNE